MATEYWMITTRREDGMYETLLIEGPPVDFMSLISKKFVLLFAMQITKEQFEQNDKYFSG